MFRNATRGTRPRRTAGDIFRTSNGGSHVDAASSTATPSSTACCSPAPRPSRSATARTFLVVAGRRRHVDPPGHEPGRPHRPRDDFMDVRCASATTCLSPAPASASLTGRPTAAGASTTRVRPTRSPSTSRPPRAPSPSAWAAKPTISDDGGAQLHALGRPARARRRSPDARARVLDGRRACPVGATRRARCGTVDGGETWANIGVPTSADAAWTCGSRPRTSATRSTARGGLFRTDNGGGSWSILDTGVDMLPLTASSPPTRRRCS